jgi:hypothetical protein
VVLDKRLHRRKLVSGAKQTDEIGRDFRDLALGHQTIGTWKLLFSHNQVRHLLVSRINDHAGSLPAGTIGARYFGIY